MSVIRFSAIAMAIATGFAVQSVIANPGQYGSGQYGHGHNWMPPTPNQGPVDQYWAAPDWSGSNHAPSRQAAPRAQNFQAPPPNYYAPPPQPQYGPAYGGSGYGYPPRGMGNVNRHSEQSPQQKVPSSRAYPPPSGPYSSQPPVPPSYYGPDSGASAFYTPGYRKYRRNGWDNNKFWGSSGPSKWFNPNKGNMERGWDDMINMPSRMGEMPGGWYAPEVTMPNPIDMGDQMQDNLQDLPEQIKDMNVGNDVSN